MFILAPIETYTPMRRPTIQYIPEDKYQLTSAPTYQQEHNKITDEPQNVVLESPQYTQPNNEQLQKPIVVYRTKPLQLTKLGGSYLQGQYLEEKPKVVYIPRPPSTPNKNPLLVRIILKQR